MIEVDGKLVPNYAATIKPFEEGDVVNGEVVRIDKDEVLVDIGYKSEGVIPAHELSIRRSVDPADEVDLGEIVDALVLTKEDQEGRLILSKKRARFEKAWRKIEAAAETGEPVEGSVIEVVKGGLILDLGVRGFLPASLVDIRRVHNLEEFRDQTLECKVIELNRSRNNVVLSRRAVLEEERKEVREQILERLQPGQIVEGKISNIVDFGAFVDLEGIDGLIHISELSWSHVNHPSEVLEIGQDVRVKVLDIDRDRQRISLGLKQTQEDPWQKVLNEYRQGDVLEGKVTKVVAFGAFIEIVPGVEGLVHISELAEHHVETPGEVVTPGEEKWVRILEIDEERRRISLSIKRAETKNNAFSDLIPDELKQQVQAASDDAAAAEAADGAPDGADPRKPRATEAPARGRGRDRGRHGGARRRSPRPGPLRGRLRGRTGRARARRGASRRHQTKARRGALAAPRPAFIGLTGAIGSGKSEALCGAGAPGRGDALDRRGRARGARGPRGRARSSSSAGARGRERRDGRPQGRRRDRLQRSRTSCSWLESITHPKVGEKVWEWRAGPRRRTWSWPWSRCRCSSRRAWRPSSTASLWSRPAIGATRGSRRAATPESRGAPAASSPRRRRPSGRHGWWRTTARSRTSRRSSREMWPELVVGGEQMTATRRGRFLRFGCSSSPCSAELSRSSSRGSTSARRSGR